MSEICMAKEGELADHKHTEFKSVDHSLIWCLFSSRRAEAGAGSRYRRVNGERDKQETMIDKGEMEPG